MGARVVSDVHVVRSAAVHHQRLAQFCHQFCACGWGVCLLAIEVAGLCIISCANFLISPIPLIQALAAVITIACIIATASGIVVLLGWVIGVLEAVILVLVVGLSFDYTLHYGAAVPSEGLFFFRYFHSTIQFLLQAALCIVSA